MKKKNAVYETFEEKENRIQSTPKKKKEKKKEKEKEKEPPPKGKELSQKGSIFNDRGQIIAGEGENPYLRLRHHEFLTPLPPLNKFVPGTAPEISLFSTISVYGKRRTGKSQFVKWDLCTAYREIIPWGWVFTKTGFNSFYSSFIPRSYIIDKFDAGILGEIMNRQRKARQMAEKDPTFNARIVMIWDDYNGTDIRYNAALEDYYYTGRHFWTLNFFCAQHITLTPPAIRSNTDMVVLFNTDYADSLEHYWKDFAGKMDRDAFYRIFHMATSQEHHFLAIDNNPNTPYDKKFFIGKADVLPEDPEYTIGCEEFWAEDMDQMRDIKNGEMKRRNKLASDMAEYKNAIQVQKPTNKQFGTGGVTSTQHSKVEDRDDDRK